jgi:thiol-disulfide isomerase/thioredoxin
MRGSSGRLALKVLALAAACGPACAQATPPAAAAKPTLAAVKPAEFGGLFPAGKFANLNPLPGQPASVDLGSVVGKKPIVFVYWMAGNARSEKILLETQKMVESLGPAKDKVALIAVAAPQFGSTDTTPIKQRAQAIGLQVPSLHDDGFRILQELDVHTVPDIAIVDGHGNLRLSNGGSLKQVLEYKMDIGAAIRRVATTGQLGTYGTLPTYYPVTEMIGQKYVDFTAPSIADGVSRSFSSMFASDKINVIVFWSVDCPHCKAAMPKLNDWFKTHPDGVNIVTAAKVSDDAARTRTEEYCRLSGFSFQTLADKDLQIGSLYQVISTPTLVVIRPDGTIDSVLLSGETDLGQALELKKREILSKKS